jgi:hypothetical protein
MRYDRRLAWLVVAHLAAGVVAGALAPVELRTPLGLDRILVVPLFAVALGQAVLLALWGVGSTGPPWKRMAGLVTGAVCLEGLFAPGLRGEFLGTATVTVAVTTASLLGVRALGVGLTRRAEPDLPARPEAEGLRVSIRGLMLFTAAVALLSAGARALRATPGHLVLLMVVWALCFVAVGLVAFWAALGGGKPLRRGPVVFALSPVLGVFFAVAAHADRDGWVYVILTMLLYPAVLLGSLLVVRSCGYRLVRRSPSRPTSQGEESRGEPERSGEALRAV